MILIFLFSAKTGNSSSKMSIGYAATDEIHQIFVPGREGRILDVEIDSLGALTGILIACLFFCKKMF